MKYISITNRNIRNGTEAQRVDDKSELKHITHLELLNEL